jgi:hypothetical protein
LLLFTNHYLADLAELLTGNYKIFLVVSAGIYGHPGDIGNPHMLSLFMAELFGLAVIMVFGVGYLKKK